VIVIRRNGLAEFTPVHRFRRQQRRDTESGAEGGAADVVGDTEEQPQVRARQTVGQDTRRQRRLLHRAGLFRRPVRGENNAV